MRRPLRQLSLLLVCACLLSACGFALRGSGANSTVLPEAWRSMHLVTNNLFSEFNREVASRFAANGVQWADRETANLRLVLKPERFKQYNLSINSEARAAEYELTMSTEFSILDNASNVVMPETEVAVVKQMENDPRNVVGKAEEVRLLQAEMRAELAQQILRRIGFYAASSQATPF